MAETVVTEGARRAGMTLTFVRLPALRSAEAANDGMTDGDLGRIVEITTRYPNLIAVPTPITKFTVAIYSASPDIASKSRADIRQMRIGLLRGIFTPIKYSHGMKVTESVGLASMFDMLATHRFDVAMVEHYNAATFVRKNRLTAVYLWPHVWATDPLHLVLNKKHAALVPRLDAALQQMKREGPIDQAYVDGLRKNQIEPLPGD